MLLSILTTLSTSGINDYQKKYNNNLRRHINLQGYLPDNNYDFRKIEQLESVTAIKVIAKAIRIFLYLQEMNTDGIYIHEDDLFSHFILRPSDADEIDAVIEVIDCIFGADGLIEYYGHYDLPEEQTPKKPNFPDVAEANYLEISQECAQIYFMGCGAFDENKQYVESASYILYSSGNCIKKMHKGTAVQTLLLDNIDSAGEFIKKGKIATYYDMGYYVTGNDLFYIDLNSLERGLILHLDENRNDDDELCEVQRLIIYKGKKCLFYNGGDYIVDFEEGKPSLKKLLLGAEVRKYTLAGDYLYFIGLNGPKYTDCSGYIVKRYGILNEQITLVSQLLIHTSDTYKVLHQSIYEKYFVYVCMDITYGYKYIGYINIEELSGNSQSKNVMFCLMTQGISQIEQHQNYLIYVNADKKYSLTVHDFLTGKRNILRKNYGHTYSPFKINIDIHSWQHPSKYMRLGKWIWIRGKQPKTYCILSVD